MNKDILHQQILKNKIGINAIIKSGNDRHIKRSAFFSDDLRISTNLSSFTPNKMSALVDVRATFASFEKIGPETKLKTIYKKSDRALIAKR